MYRSNSKYASSEPAYIEANSDNSDLEAMDDQIDADSAALSQDMAIQQHLNKDMFLQAQCVPLQIELIASPAELAQTIESNVWKLMPHLTMQMKQNMSLKNRHLAGPDQLAGNLNRCIPLHLEIVQQKNSFPFAMGMHISGMMDTTLHRHGQCVWRVPADTQTMKVNESAFEPKNKVNKYMYSNYRMCTLEDLESDIKHVPKTSKKPAHANVLVGSLAYDTLIESLSNGEWQDQHGQIELDHIFEPGRNHSVQITEKMGKELKEFLREPIEEAASAFINLEDFHVTVVRADGITDFSSPKQLNGELVGSEMVEGSNLNSDRLQKRCTFHVTCKLTYIARLFLCFSCSLSKTLLFTALLIRNEHSFLSHFSCLLLPERIQPMTVLAQNTALFCVLLLHVS